MIYKLHALNITGFHPNSFVKVLTDATATRYELNIDVVDCSNALVPIYVYNIDPYNENYKNEIKVVTSIPWVDLRTGNVLSGYRPGGNAFLMGNIIEFFKSYDIDIELLDLEYWLESYCCCENSLIDIGNYIASDKAASNLITNVLGADKSVIGLKLKKYLLDCACNIDSLRYEFRNRKDAYSYEWGMIGSEFYFDDNFINSFTSNFGPFYSYLRARNKDYQALYCTKDDAFYIKVANKNNFQQFNNKESLVKNLRTFSHCRRPELVDILKCKDESLNAEIHDFFLDLEKIKVALDKC